MNRILIVIFCLLTKLNFLNAGIEYRLATLNDLPGMLQLINQQACKDKNKIVIFPEKFREIILKHNIEKGRLFVAVDTSECCFVKKTQVVAYKKLFIVKDRDELQDMLKNEIRCLDKAETKTREDEPLLEQNAIELNLQDNSLNHVNHQRITDLDSGLFIYDGADFTHPKFRNKGINKTLTDFAFESIVTNILQSKFKNILLLYGLTKENAGSEVFAGRTKSILSSFKQLIQDLPSHKKSNSLRISRYAAFMPTFDPESKELKPLPDDLSVPGYGYVMSYEIK